MGDFAEMIRRSTHTSYQSELLLRESIREILTSVDSRRTPPTISERAIKENLGQLIFSRPLMTRSERVIFERLYRDSGIKQTLLEYNNLLRENATVGDILAAFDDKVSDMDNAFGQVIDALIRIALEYAPDSIKDKVKQFSGSIDDPDNDPGEDIEQVYDWFLDLKELADELKNAWKDAKSKVTQGLKAQIKYLYKEHNEVITNTFNHFKSIKDLYNENKTFKAMLNAAGFEVLKKLLLGTFEKVVALIPYGQTIVNGLKMSYKLAKLGGKLYDLYKKAKGAAQATPQEKLAAIADKIVRGKNDDMGALGKLLQMNDDLEAVLDDKLEMDFIKFYTGALRKVNPQTPISAIDVNKVLTGWIKTQYGKPQAQVAVA